MKTFIYWNVKAKKSEAEIIEMMKKEANGEQFGYAIANV